MTINCIIIDDDLMARKSLERLCGKVEHLNIVGSFEQGQDGLDFIAKEPVDLIFLDVEMPGMTGLEFVEKAEALPLVVFTTSKAEYAYDAFEYHAVDFLKKPIALPRFSQAVEKAKEGLRQNNAYKADAKEIYIREDGRYIRIPYNDILYFENIGDYVKVQTSEKSHIIHSTLKAIDSKLKNHDFLKVHRSYIVNLRKIKDIEENTLVIEKKVIPISRANKKGLMNKLNVL